MEECLGYKHLGVVGRRLRACLGPMWKGGCMDVLRMEGQEQAGVPW